MNFKTKNILKYLVYCFINTLILSSLKPDIFPQGKDKTTNWPEPVFEHITIADGLPENSVFAMLQDRFGYMWLGTQNGLVRYDGYGMKVFSSDSEDTLSISGAVISAIYEDKEGTLWVGTLAKGLNRFDRKTEIFTRFLHNPDDSNSISIDTVLCINEDKKGNILIGTEGGLVLFKKSENTFNNIERVTDNGTTTPPKHAIEAIILDSLTKNIYVSSESEILIYDSENELLRLHKISETEDKLGIIYSFYQGKDGTIWIGHSKGLARFNSQKNTIRFFQPDTSGSSNFKNTIYQITEDENGYFWCGTLSLRWKRIINSNGLLCFNPLEENFKRYKYNSQNESGISDNDIGSIFKDRSGVIWVGTWEGGLNKWDYKKQKFTSYRYDSENLKRISLRFVKSFAEDPGGTIWVGGNGLYIFDPFSKNFKDYWKKQYVYSIYVEDSKTVWIATYSGLGKINTASGNISFYTNNPLDSTTISHNWVLSILPEGNEILWIVTVYGLNKFYKSTGKFIRYIHNPGNQQNISQDIRSLLKDRSGSFWIGTYMKLYKFNLVDETFKPLRFYNGSIPVIYEDKVGNLWIGTYGGGLHLFDREKEVSVLNITNKDGLATNQVRSLLEDDHGNLWIGTSYGLSKFDPETRRIRNYYVSDIYEENSYVKAGVTKTSTGEMLFASSKGFIMFHPDSIKDDPVPPQVVISNVSLFNRPDDKLEFDGFISEMKELSLSYNKNDLRFNYVGLHYGDPLKNKYKYMLEGYDKDWVDAGTQRNAVYTNLDAGEYVFRVTACNLDGVWNEEGKTLKIIIHPPIWATWWAYSLYILFGLAALYSIRRYELNRTNLKNQLKLDEVKLKEREETDRMKSRFFANISHEFRTPLTLILGPSQSIVADSKEEETRKKAGTIKRNARHLLGLINQLLDLSKLEAGKLELRTSKFNIVPFIKGITMSFESVAERKDITLKVKSSSDEIELYFDKEKMTKIMTNLLSNAFKFTPEGGAITVALTLIPSPSGRGMSNLSAGALAKAEAQGEGKVLITVKDTGIGISEEELPKLFDRFYQVDSSQTREHEGTGIGLALTKELVELHRGTISVDSKLGSGTEIIIELPVGRSHLKDEEIVEGDVILSEVKNLILSESEKDTVSKDSSSSVESRTPQNDGVINEDKNIILVVEDNAAVREFIKDSLGNEFQIEEASNGEQGVRKAVQIIPDLILSDVMMPKMDGNELTRILKNDEKTSHIPIILLTAKSEQQSKLEGLETGADDYLTKPFDTKELQIRINNLINIRKKLQQKFGKPDYVPVKKVEGSLSRPIEDRVGKLSNIEEQFMSKIMEVIENHLSEEEFSIEQFGKEVGMSRMQLHRKLKALSGKSASNYLRSVRLAKAKKMIEEKTGSISEIAYSVGFSSPQYFTRSFKEEFGFPPSDLL